MPVCLVRPSNISVTFPTQLKCEEKLSHWQEGMHKRLLHAMVLYIVCITIQRKLSYTVCHSNNDEQIWCNASHTKPHNAVNSPLACTLHATSCVLLRKLSSFKRISMEMFHNRDTLYVCVKTRFHVWLRKQMRTWKRGNHVHCLMMQKKKRFLSD